MRPLHIDMRDHFICIAAKRLMFESTTENFFGYKNLFQALYHGMLNVYI